MATIEKQVKVVNKYGSGGGGMVYFLGVIGALFYYLPHSAGFLDAIWRIIESLLWPAFLVYNLFQFLHL